MKKNINLCVVSRYRIGMVFCAVLSCSISLPGSAVGNQPEDACGMSAEEQKMAILLVNDPGQQRPNLRCNPTLVETARAWAKYLAEHGIVGHLNTDGVTPNERLRTAGYPLAGSYPKSSNQVEASAGSPDSLENVWRGWMNSKPHRLHLLAENPLYAEQDEYGVGKFSLDDSPHQHYWVVHTARQKYPGESQVVCTPAPHQCFSLSTIQAGPATK